MARRREQAAPRLMKPVFLVFCEGETEENYLDFIRRKYKSPIKIVSSVEGNQISQNLIEKRQQELKISKNEKIKTFLMYDLDVKVVNAKLKSCDAEWLCSNPCIELWFLLHSKLQTIEITTDNCLKTLINVGGVWKEYKKSVLTETQKNYLWDNKTIAIDRAKKLTENENPSSGIYKLLETIENSLNILNKD